MTLQELETIVQKHMLLADTQIIKLLAAFVVAARLPISAPWLIIVSAASNGKSTLLSALEDCPAVFKVDNLTPKTFFSGMKAKEGEPSNSLIERLPPNHAVLTIKDMSTLISKNEADLGEIMAQLRLIYDGNFDAAYGNGRKITWKGKLSLLCGGTASVYDYLPKMSSMGDRFLLYFFDSPDRQAQGEKSLENLDEKISNAEIKKAFTEFIGGIKLPKEVHNISPELRTTLVKIAELATRARTAVNRNKYKKDAFESGAYLEATPRFARQLLSFAIGLMVVNGEWKLTPGDEQIIFKIALDTIPRYRREVLQTLTKFAVVETRGVATKMNMPTDAIRNILQDLEYVQMVKRTETAANRDKWELKPEYRVMLSQYENITMVDDILLEGDDTPPLPADDGSIPANVPEYMIAKE